MTRKDYVAIAADIRATVAETLAAHDVAATAAVSTLTYRLADTLKADNGRFDRERFLDAAIGQTFI